MSKQINVIKLGLISYSNGLKIQNYYINKIKSKILDKDNKIISNPQPLDSNSNINLGTLLLLQHTPVYTIGIRNLKEYDKDLELKLKTLNCDYYKTNRGGLITFHGPGQLIIYPIVNLKLIKPSIKHYIGLLEKTIINLCKEEYNLNADLISDYTGVWINSQSKICSVGVHSSLYITSHGLGLNCNTDLSYFDHIIPCGINDKKVTSLSEQLDKNITVDDVIPKYIKHFQYVFQCKSNYTVLDKEIQNQLS